MRSEKEMLDLILNFANDDKRIRAVILNGSRANPNAPRDLFQDYDIMYIVSSVDDFVQDRSWINTFGELIMMQTPDEKVFPPPDPNDGSFAFLMLFTDGNRIDLTFYPADNISELRLESTSLLLLDKDGILEPLPPASDKDGVPAPPAEKEFQDCCNEFWWITTNIAKGLWRKELPYVKYMYDRPARDALNAMLSWYIGTQTGFSVDTGKFGKYFEKYLDPKRWKAFVQTFPDGEYDNIWQSLFVMCDLFRETAIEVALHFGFPYPYDDDRRVTDYLKRVRVLPRDAESIF
ncbi:aminoglycoside 6-adenylyltransferase [Polycladomyces sp. WAk]|uniref:Aminoglycoside 6-adenylyltransferase n=1 Tax=Polycladomyces zharkentensis TaxID=2807616 RepID=A0ABS2WJE9_9BACL|nr:aminoglycoside 6-adenylyltransferase [Polycladomyces sp. WAk]MBN2909605.1 aminoglycoside 6-adenylyltransferase [Polycladomyces sp. WAk]